MTGAVPGALPGIGSPLMFVRYAYPPNDRLTQRQVRALRDFTVRHLDLVNHRVEHPGTVAVLG